MVKFFGKKKNKKTSGAWKKSTERMKTKWMKEIFQWQFKAVSLRFLLSQLFIWIFFWINDISADKLFNIFFHFLFQFHLNKWQLSAVKATKLYKTFARLSEEDILRFFMSIIFCAWLKCLTEVTVEVESSNVVETPFEPCESTTEDFGHEVPKDIFFTESRQCLLQYFLPHRISV